MEKQDWLVIVIRAECWKILKHEPSKFQSGLIVSAIREAIRKRLPTRIERKAGNERLIDGWNLYREQVFKALGLEDK